MFDTRPAQPPVAAAPLPPARAGELETYLTQVALGRTLGLRRRLGEPACPVLDVHASIARNGGRSAGFMAALKAFTATQAADQRALLHDVDAGLTRALGRRAQRLADNAGPLGAELLHWWAGTVVALCAGEQPLVRCAGLHLLWAHVLTGQVIAQRIGAASTRPDDHPAATADMA